MPSDTRPTPQTAQSPNVVDTIDPELLAQLNAKRDNLVYAYEQIAQALRYAAKACDEFQALIPRDVGIIPGDLGVSSQSIGSQRKFKKPQIKDPNAPKRPNTAYILFSNEIRADTKAANPQANQKEIVTLIGQKWKALSREEKKVYEDRYFADKERYDEELRAYRATHGQVESPPETSSNEDNGDPNASGAASSSKQVHTSHPFVSKQVQTGTKSHFASQLHMSQVDSTALGGQVLPISVPPSETDTTMLDSIISTFPTDSTTFTQTVSSDKATTSLSKKRRSPEPRGGEKQDEEASNVKRTRASSKKNQTTTEPGQDGSVFTPPDDPEASTEQDEAVTGTTTKRQRTKRSSANGSVTPAQGSKTTSSTTRRKRGVNNKEFFDTFM
ncbi:unnamed protein product [Rhizophagus irregularis]|nr:unnamed protein product [Rhizophagus irregularis]